MKKQILSFFVILLAGAPAFASNKALNTTTSGYLKTSTAPFTGNMAFTFELWFNGSGASTYGRLISFSNFAFEIATGNNTINVYDGSWRATGVTGMNSGWHHVAVSNDMSNMVVYVDGAQVYTKASATFNFTGQNMFVAAQGKTQASNERFVGKIDELRIWNKARTLQEINDTKDMQLLGTESGLVAYYDFNDGNANNKGSGANLNLTLTSSPAFLTTNYVDYLNDYALDFDAADDKLSMATPLSGNSDFTLETQFKTTAGNAQYYRRIFGWSAYAFEVAIVNGRIYTYKGSWSSPSVYNFNDGQWHHLAITKSGTTVSIYIDATLLGTRTLTLALNGNMYVGGPYDTEPTDHYGGQLDEVRIWNVARTQPEIEASMNGELVGNESGLIHYFDFNTPSSATAVLNEVSGGASITRSGASSTNNLPKYTAATKNSIATSVADVPDPSSDLLTIYPNPATSTVNLNIPQATKVVLMDAAGKTVLSLYNPTSQIDLSSLNAGLYFMNVYSENAVQTALVMKQ
ncbi:MAG: LamG-like jellyroll fold domain-containing protein [Flavobacteriales bacterium]